MEILGLCLQKCLQIHDLGVLIKLPHVSIENMS